MVLVAISALFTMAPAQAGDVADQVSLTPGPVEAWVIVESSVPTGTSYLLFEQHGGFWADAEKDPDPGDNLLCWAATASNMMEWTGWGFVDGMEGADDFLQYFRAHVSDQGSNIEYGVEWWFNGNLQRDDDRWAEELVEGGNFWAPTYNYADYVRVDTKDHAETMTKIDEALKAGRAVGIDVRGGGAHAITCWGFNYDPDVGVSDKNYYKGIWVTDSDDNKNVWNPDDTLRYYSVTWNEDESRWDLGGGYSGWYIRWVVSLAPFPGETRPIADCDVPMFIYEGGTVTFDASISVDDDDLQYRWDMDGDGIWDVDWTSDPELYWTWFDDWEGKVYLEVFDGRLRDMMVMDIVVMNVDPQVIFDQALLTVDEGSQVTLTGHIYDPGINDIQTVTVDWGDGTIETHTVDLQGSDQNPFSFTHVYLDDNPTATPFDDYTVTVSVTDGDGGSGVDYATVTVYNVAPIITGTGDEIDENDVATIGGTIYDPGIEDTFILTVNWGDGTITIQELEAGTTSWSMSHQYLDDDPTGTPQDVYKVTVTIVDDDTGMHQITVDVLVRNLDPVIETFTMDQPNPEFILPVVHELTFLSSFTDVGTLDTHSVIFDWGDGTSSPGIVTQGAGWGTVVAYHTYMSPGTYIVTMTLEDDDTGTDSRTMVIEVVTAQEALAIMNEHIQDMDDEAFKNNADNRKAALENMIMAIISTVDTENYNGAINDLTNNLLAKMDGSLGGNEKNDWIIDADEQAALAQKINDIVAYLLYLM